MSEINMQSKTLRIINNTKKLFLQNSNGYSINLLIIWRTLQIWYEFLYKIVSKSKKFEKGYTKDRWMARSDNLQMFPLNSSSSPGEALSLRSRQRVNCMIRVIGLLLCAIKQLSTILCDFAFVNRRKPPFSFSIK